MAIGLSVDLNVALYEGTFPRQSEETVSVRPWTGYLFLLEESEKGKRPVKIQEPHFQVRHEFRHASYEKRYELFLRKLMLKQYYDSTCFLLSRAEQRYESNNYTEPAKDLTASQFLTKLLNHVQLALEIV